MTHPIDLTWPTAGNVTFTRYAFNLANAGVHPKTAQVLARHSTISLTMERYTHVDVSELALALEKVKPIRGQPGEGFLAQQLA